MRALWTTDESQSVTGEVRLTAVDGLMGGIVDCPLEPHHLAGTLMKKNAINPSWYQRW